MKKQYVLYDARAEYDEDEATIYCLASTLEEARADKKSMFNDACIFEYDVKGIKLINGRRVS